MAKITFIASNGSTHSVETPVGVSIMKAAVDNGLDGIVAECGGSLACATCHVYVSPEFANRISPASGIENDLLDCTASERLPNSRLSCQIRMSDDIDGIVVEIPEAQA
ncbi:2Fe-2S iron-sulfur cluster-binding protein [Tardiphaga robiniae]|uniref:2Fe-2S iron-sulfur cluster binding domain-containing protein n=1 Tax=Tardiphaga robiniae TaxID=943830 RepID=A0A7G6U1K5_9BRAD|nr:2Fe-2S iron-sulfur cluster-binding protein [Tardiphaga robiniae]QND72887.1 2Fe-2S iron-sulfur cluster binding domain-containing protein [Tardiphaga robiniae]